MPIIKRLLLIVSLFIFFLSSPAQGKIIAQIKGYNSITTGVNVVSNIYNKCNISAEKIALTKSAFDFSSLPAHHQFQNKNPFPVIRSLSVSPIFNS